jgi:apolipoprotein D and lipocalin family protein
MTKYQMLILGLPLILLFGLSCDSKYPPLEVVKYVDLSRYLGKWYEIARLPNSFQKDCYCSTAEYSLIDEETIRVINRCFKDSINGEPDEAKGKAYVVPNSNNAKLRVQFFWPFKGDYWIIDLDEKNYTYAVVGHPNRKYLWILSREQKMNDTLYVQLLEKAKTNGFDITQIIKSEASGK